MNYKALYDDLVRNALNRTFNNSYREKHHIIPKSMGGSDLPDNLVELTGREHFIAHKLLAKIYGGPMSYAFMMMCNVRINEHGIERFKVSSRDYELAKKLISLERSGIPRTEECKNKISKSQKARFLDPAKRRKCATRLGIPNSPVQRKQISDKMKGIPKPLVDPCPHCGKVCNKATAVRWHYDNCKRKV